MVLCCSRSSSLVVALLGLLFQGSQTSRSSASNLVGHSAAFVSSGGLVPGKGMLGCIQAAQTEARQQPIGTSWRNCQRHYEPSKSDIHPRMAIGDSTKKHSRQENVDPEANMPLFIAVSPHESSRRQVTSLLSKMAFGMPSIAM
jgi:hypothetical protein